MNTGRVPSARKFAPDQDAEKRAKLPDSGKCSEESANKAIYSGQKFVALTGGGVICYPNLFTPTTSYARVRMEDRRAQSHPFVERVFVWEFR